MLLTGLLLERTADLLSYALRFSLGSSQPRSPTLLHPTRCHRTFFAGHSAIRKVGNGTPTLATDTHGRSLYASALNLLAGELHERSDCLLSFELQNRAVTHR
jgi:hypothetical protein